MQAETGEVRGRQVRLWHGGEGPAILLLHGGGADAEGCWAPVWDRLSARYRVFAPDLPGSGGSQPLARPDPSAFIAWLDQLIVGLAAAPVRLVGCGEGATLARAYAASHPERCEALVLINGGDLPTAPERLLARLGLGPRPDGAEPRRRLWQGDAPRRAPTVHTLVLLATEDPAEPRNARRLGRQLPHATFRWAPGRGDLPQVEAPGETADILLAFLA